MRRRKCQGTYQGTEVTADTPNLVLEDLVVEPRLEFTLARGGRGDVHGGLATAEDDKVLLAGDAGTVEGRIGGVGLEDLEVLGGDELGGVSGPVLGWGDCRCTYLGRLVLAGGDEVCPVGGPLEIGNGLVEVVDGVVGNQIAGLHGLASVPSSTGDSSVDAPCRHTARRNHPRARR